MFLFLTSNGISLYSRKTQRVMRDYRNELLNKSTSAEKSVCRILDKLGVKFIRQYKIQTPRKTFYIDIYVPALNACIEVDGKYHFTDKQKRLDSNRSACIRRMGLSVIRICNTDAYSAKSVKSMLQRHILRQNRKKNK